jgi:hypothetical protein
MSIGKDLGKSIDDNSNKMLLLFIPNLNKKKELN